MDITVFSWMRNEEDILPFFLRHYSFANRLIVWDNESTDRTREILKADPRVEVRDWITGGEMRDLELMKMKSNEYRNTGDGWKIIVDADEFVWHPSIGVNIYLEMCDGRGITIPQIMGYDMVSDLMPVDDGKSLLVDLVKDGIRSVRYDKVCVIRDCVNIEYGPGCHGYLGASGRMMASREMDLRLLHYRYLSKERVVRKAVEYKPSEDNRKYGMGVENNNVEEMSKRWEEAWSNKERVI